MKNSRLVFLAVMFISLVTVTLHKHQFPLIPLAVLLLATVIFAVACSYVFFGGKPRHVLVVVKEEVPYKVLMYEKTTCGRRVIMCLRFANSDLYCYGKLVEVVPPGWTDTLQVGETVFYRGETVKKWDGDGDAGVTFDIKEPACLYVVRHQELRVAVS